MSSGSSFTIEIPSMSNIDANAHADDKKFREIVFDFIERIAREVSMYEDGESTISANDFKHIELQIQAQRVENVLKLCISKIQCIFLLSYLIEHQYDHLTLLFPRQDAQRIKTFAQKWLHSIPDSSDRRFNAELNDCLNAVDKADIQWKSQKVIK